jgi:hypothetical protein
MTLGLSLEAFTRLHVALSLVGIVSGLIVLFGLIARRRLAGWTALFVVTIILTSVTGFGFPFVVQAFLKIPALSRLAPNQTEAPFVIAQLAVLALVIVLTVVAARRFRA